MYSIIESIVPGLPQTPFRNGKGNYEGVVAHATDSFAIAPNEINYMSTNFENAFVHFFVDWNGVYQCASTDYKAYGAGPKANPRFVHVEFCQTHDPEQFKVSYSNYVWILGKLLADRKLGVTPDTLWSHRRVTNELGGTTHTDPDDYLQSWGKSWEDVQNDVLYIYNQLTQPATVDPRIEKAEIAAKAVAYMRTLLDQNDGDGEWAKNFLADIYDNFKSKGAF